MKNLNEIFEALVSKHTMCEALVKGNVANITKRNEVFEAFKKDIEKILKEYGLQKVKNKDAADTDKPFVIHKLISYEDARYSGMPWNQNVEDGTINYYEFNYYVDKDVKTWKSICFSLDLHIWYDTNLERPRYYFNNLFFHLPHTRTQGYKMPYTDRFKCIRLIEKYYNTGIESIKNIIGMFVNNKTLNKMEECWSKPRSKNRNPQRADFDKVYALFSPFIYK